MFNTNYIVDLVAFARECLQFQPHPAQLRALDPFIRNGILNCSRQWGKSTAVSVRAIHYAYFFPESLTVVASPTGRQGFFYEQWQKGEAAGWACITSPVTECPHITARFIDKQRGDMPDAVFRQEFLCEFTTADFGYFDPTTIDNAFLQPGEPRPARSRYYLGFDVGQARDYSAIAILERRVEFTGEVDAVTFERKTRTRVIVHHLERIPLRTSYPDVVARVRELTLHPTYATSLEILMDSTGVGAAVRDMLNAAHLKCRVTGITLTGGERVSLSPGLYHVPRHDLLINLRVLLEKQMLEITAPGPHTEALRTELYRWGQRSAHDDLVFAVALAAWKAGGQPLHQLHGPNPIPMLYPEVRK